VTQKISETLQYLGLYQLENLQRQQAKFFLVALTDSTDQVPVHPLLKLDFVLNPSAAAETLSGAFKDKQLPMWWPVVLISSSGDFDVAVANQLAAQGISNVFTYKDGWTALVAEK